MQQSIEIEARTTDRVGPRTTRLGHCPACRDPNAQFVFKGPDRLHRVPGEYIYRRCGSCRTVFQDPRVIAEDLALCYPKEYHTHFRQDAAQPMGLAPDPSSRSLSRVRDRVRQAVVASVQGLSLPGATGALGRTLAMSRRLRERAFYNHVTDELIPRAPGQLRALDVGCGPGYLISALQRVGWEAEGVEWDPVAAEIARTSTGCQVWQGDFRDVELPLGAYDLVVLNHVFEHIEEPVETMHRIGELLKPEGRGVLRYPNPDALGARIFGSSWYPWEAPRHLVLLTGDALAQVSKRVGLSIKHLRTTSAGAVPFFAHSRAYQAGRRVDEFCPEISYLDRIAAALEGVLVGLGFKIGEELVVVFQRSSQSTGSLNRRLGAR